MLSKDAGKVKTLYLKHVKRKCHMALMQNRQTDEEMLTPYI